MADILRMFVDPRTRSEDARDAVDIGHGIDVQYDGFAAVRGASVSIRGGRTLALVGESGSGKSSLALAAARLLPPGTDVAGSIRVGDRELSELKGEELRAARGRIVGYLAQDAMAALNPVMRVGKQVAEVYERHEKTSSARRADARRRPAAARRHPGSRRSSPASTRTSCPAACASAS